MVKNYFEFAGQKSTDYGLTIEAYPDYIAGERIIEKKKVPGRNGALVFDTGAYSNAAVSYEVWCKGDYADLRGITRWLMQPNGYQRLSDSYDDEVYRMALCSNPIQFDVMMKRYGRATIEFDCQPQRFFLNGETEIDVSSGTLLTNPGMPALPIITVTGSGAGQITVGAYVVGISDIPTTGLVLDCDLQDAYSGTENKNGLITLSDGFPVLESGENEIAYSGGVTSLKIIPRWWTL